MLLYLSLALNLFFFLVFYHRLKYAFGLGKVAKERKDALKARDEAAKVHDKDIAVLTIRNRLVKRQNLKIIAQCAKVEGVSIDKLLSKIEGEAEALNLEAERIFAERSLEKS